MLFPLVLYLLTNNVILKQLQKLTKTQLTFTVRTFLNSNEKLKHYLLTRLDFKLTKSLFLSLVDEAPSSKTFTPCNKRFCAIVA